MKKIISLKSGDDIPDGAKLIGKREVVEKGDTYFTTKSETIGDFIFGPTRYMVTPLIKVVYYDYEIERGLK